MKMILKDIKEYVKLLKRTFMYRISLLPEPPKLAIIQVGNNEASNRYVRNKVKDCEEVGISAHVYGYPENMTELELDDELNHLQEFYDGVIVQLPLPPHIRSSIATAAILPEKDVDGFRSDSKFNPATPKGIMKTTLSSSLLIISTRLLDLKYPFCVCTVIGIFLLTTSTDSTFNI